MRASEASRRTPITGRIDRGDRRVRLIEEAILLIRGEWPAVACGLCESVNRARGLLFAQPSALDQAIEEAASEAERLVTALFGPEALVDVRRLASVEDSNTISANRRGARGRPIQPASFGHRRLRFRGG